MSASTTIRCWFALLLCAGCKTQPLHAAPPLVDMAEPVDQATYSPPPPDLACAPHTEVCNGVDDDCDGQTDEGCPKLVWESTDYASCTGMYADDWVAVVSCLKSGGKPSASYLVIVDLVARAERLTVERLSASGAQEAYALGDGVVAWLLGRTLFTLTPAQAAPVNHGVVDGKDPISLSVREGIVLAQSPSETRVMALDIASGQRRTIDLSVVPSSLVYWRNQALFFYDATGRLERCDAQSALCTPLGSAFYGINSLVVSPGGPMGLWHQDTPSNTVWTVDEATGERTLLAGAPFVMEVVGLRDLFAWQRGYTIEAKRIGSARTVAVGQGQAVALTEQSALLLTRSAGGKIALVERPLLDEEL